MADIAKIKESLYAQLHDIGLSQSDIKERELQLERESSRLEKLINELEAQENNEMVTKGGRAISTRLNKNDYEDMCRAIYEIGKKTGVGVRLKPSNFMRIACLMASDNWNSINWDKYWRRELEYIHQTGQRRSRRKNATVVTQMSLGGE